MNLLKSVRVLIIVIPAVLNQAFKPQLFQQGKEICNKLVMSPYFETDMVVGRPWRIYYSWNMRLEDKCLDMTFKNATPMIINRVWNDMYEYLESQPYWDAATLLVSMGRARHEMLLFADQGAAGRFVGVPNVVRDGNISPTKRAVPLLTFHLKLLFGGKYLLMSDCQIGVTTMSARSDKPPYRAEIQGIAAKLKYGDGFPSCISDKNKDEQTGMK